MAARRAEERVELTLEQLREEILAEVRNDGYLAEALRRIEKKLDLILFLLRGNGPGPLHFQITGETNAMIQFKVQLPALPADASDIDKAELTVTVGTDAPQVMTLGKNETVVEGLTGPKNADVELSFVYLDAAGNRSAHPSTAKFTLVDTFAPPDPGVLGLVEVAEVADPVSPPPPAPEPVTPPAPPVEPAPPAPEPTPPAPPADPAAPPVPPTA